MVSYVLSILSIKYPLNFAVALKQENDIKFSGQSLLWVTTVVYDRQLTAYVNNN